MSIKVSVITTANRTRCFTLDNDDSISHLLDSLKRSAHMFSGKPLIVGSAAQTEIFAASSIACIELETDSNLDGYLPGGQNLLITALSAEEALAPCAAGFAGESIKARIDLGVALSEPHKKAKSAHLTTRNSVRDRPFTGTTSPLAYCAT